MYLMLYSLLTLLHSIVELTMGLVCTITFSVHSMQQSSVLNLSTPSHSNALKHNHQYVCVRVCVCVCVHVCVRVCVCVCVPKCMGSFGALCQSTIHHVIQVAMFPWKPLVYSIAMLMMEELGPGRLS